MVTRCRRAVKEAGGKKAAREFFSSRFFSHLKLICKTLAQQLQGKVFRRLSRSELIGRGFLLE